MTKSEFNYIFFKYGNCEAFFWSLVCSQESVEGCFVSSCTPYFSNTFARTSGPIAFPFFSVIIVFCGKFFIYSFDCNFFYGVLFPLCQFHESLLCFQRTFFRSICSILLSLLFLFVFH